MAVLPQPFQQLEHVLIRQDLVRRWREEVLPFHSCTACPLHHTALRHVIAKGDVPAQIIFIGEGPGHSEDVDGLPFDPNAPAGEVLYSLIQDLQARIGAYAILITNVVACRPNDMHKQVIRNYKTNGCRTVYVPGYQNRAPNEEEAKSCRPRLDRILSIAQPEVVVCLGRIATQFVETDLPTVHIHHPSAIARSGGINSQSYKRALLTLVKEIPLHV